MPINPSQKIPSASRGKLLSADMVNTIVAAMKRMVVGGDGIRVEVMGDQIRINAKRQLFTPRGAGGGGGNDVGRFTIPTVEELPAVPTNGNTMQIVQWTSAGAGDGDDGLWWTKDGMTRWYPMVYSSINGTPGSTELTG